MMQLKNTRKGPIIGTDIQRREDTEIVNIGCETRFVEPEEIGEFDESSRAVKIYVKAGYLSPVDAEGKKWARTL